ncbi:MAG TPA: peptidoglycan DD-metalloendopeptidase family protein [Amaricoccus sp.]|nr:peptidoglycan DD-metalloendopeptidase family protein [Amaricoccus sp.]
MTPRAAVLLLAVLAAPAFAGASGPGAAVGAASAQVAQAGVALEAARGDGPERLAALAAAVEGYEAALAGLRTEVGAAGARAQALAVGLAARREAVARLLATLEAASRTPPPAQALHPDGPLAAARAAAMMARIEPALRAEAREIATALAAVAAAQRLHGQGTAELAAGLATLGTAQAELSAALAAASPAPAEPSPALVALARASETLTALAAALDAAGGAPAPPGPAGEAMDWPARGELLRRFNEPDAAGARRPGVVLRAPPRSLVRAPADATVRYAGPFLEYGYVLVLEPAAGTMVVLAGLAQLQVREGARVGRGDIVGMLGGRPLGAEEYVMLPQAETGAGGGETLYIEVRQGRGPVDPEPLFARKG